VQGLIIFNHDTYVPERWHGTLLAWAVTAAPLFCNIFARKVLAPLELLAGAAHLVFFVVVIAVLLAMSPRSPASFVFTGTVFGASGWNAPGVEWCIGLLSATFPLSGRSNVL
jgi:choline transport protein